MRLSWKVVLLVYMMSPLLDPLASAATSHDSKNVLVLYADRPDSPGHRVFEQSLRSNLTASVVADFDFYHEVIDVSRFPGERYLWSLREFYRQKYAARKIDVIMVSGRLAREFLLLYQEDVWPGVPIGDDTPG